MHVQDPIVPGARHAHTTSAEAIGPPDLVTSDEASRQAYERGGEAGMRDAQDEENPYPEGCVLARAFEHGYLDGQKARR